MDLETVSGAHNWKLTLRREGEGVTILRAVTCERRAALPEEVLGLPVTALGRHALSPTAAPVTGEEVTIEAGPASDRWDNRELEELTLPRGLWQVGDYAFFNCTGLKRLRLHDGIRYWGGGALMNCRRLDTLDLTRAGEEGETLAYFADELSRELDVTLRFPGGEVCRLIFPEYQEAYEENCPAHHFDYTIYGPGYPYHHCFHQKKLQLPAYDRLWPGMLGMEHDENCALRLAFWRLRHPFGLLPEAEGPYRDYLEAHAGAAMEWLLRTGDTDGLAFLLSAVEAGGEDLAAACGLARRLERTAALALLLEKQRPNVPRGLGKTFDL